VSFLIEFSRWQGFFTENGEYVKKVTISAKSELVLRGGNFMKQWSKEIDINAPIEQVWKYLDGSLEEMQLIMPQVMDNRPIKVTDEKVGSIHRQTYKEGNRVQEYEVETLEYENNENDKRLKVGFSIANMFEITALYELKRLDDNKTKFTYTATNRALKWFVNIFLLFASEKVVVQFLERVKKVAEAEYQTMVV
jgi:uncharacterized membrane protein